MKKLLFIFLLLASTFSFGENVKKEIRKVDSIVSSRQDIKERLSLLKEKEIYVQKLEKGIVDEKKSNLDLDEKYEKLEKKYLKMDLDDLDTKQKFLEFEKKTYEELFERIEKVEKNI